MTTLPTILAVHGVASLAAFVAYGFDKSRSRRGGRRVPENTLHLLALLCGWPGALLGSRVFRHKTQKLSFRLVLFAIVALHAVAWLMAWRAGWIP